MHDPKTVAFDIYLGPKKKKNGQYRDSFITIWHKDPEKDGSDDSCGWFMRSRHGDPMVMKKIRDAIDFDFDRTFTSDDSGTTYYTGYFSPSTGMPNMSAHAITLDMFKKAAWVVFEGNRKRYSRWMKDNLFGILDFAENPVDSLGTNISGIFRIGTASKWKREEALNEYVSIIYGWILRSTRKWYQHPRWHIHHWSIQFRPWQRLKRRYWDKCYKCGKRGFKTSAYSDWNGTKLWHEGCDTTTKVAVPTPPPVE
jgi:hypothetical protein